MSVDPLSGGGAAALARAEARARAAMDDLLLADEVRLPDRVRTAASTMLRACVDAIEEALRAESEGRAYRTLERAGLLREPMLVEELVGEAARGWLEERLLPEPDGGQLGLTARLATDADPRVEAAALAFAQAQLHARSMLPRVQLPRELHRRLTWLVAAAIRADGDGRAEGGGRTDAVLVEAASSLPEGETPAAAAGRLADAVVRRGVRPGPLLIDALRDRSVTLFLAILARVAGLDYGQARMVLLEPAETMLWVALRGAGLNRGEMATIGAMLAQADPRRDLDLLADTLDRVVALSGEMVDRALAPLRLPAEFRQAVRALEAAR